MTHLLQMPTPAAQMEITEALAEAVAAAAKLPVEDQNYLAWRIIEETAEEKKWSDSFAGSLDVLEQMASEALREHANYDGLLRQL